MKLSGSCQCGSIGFEMESKTPYPYMRCYCSICRKVGGSGGYAINLMAEADSIKIRGADAKGVYNAVVDGKASQAERHFCKSCGSHLWLWDPRWPELIHPHAGAIDTPLPRAPETLHIMLEFKPDWIDVPDGPGHVHFQRYPDLSIEEWHKSHDLYED
ncbi:Glutathione-dependent formaldehyde-activating enzyme [Labrenzia sp. THAF82]|uniref:GFA family protein n=1 Tax=Labrenzia sp. THAF82 TaxID=2587861 RepID=UPI001267D625|nr:GFA family protein [Labrenzia sp. THAF82]QFT32404.1 Glutathione-dependent formaldehyde-activating enzyme [Labrenzia sp. THAF82]